VTAVAALGVCVFAPSGWYGSDVAAGYAIAAGCFVAARRYVQDISRRDLVVAVVCLAGLYEFSQAFTSWWGGGDPSVVMAGTFYWRNPYAAFLLPGAVVGLGLIAAGRSPWNLVGWFSVPICAAGIVFSSSRATLAVMILAWFAFVVAMRRQRPALKRTIGGIGLAVALTVALPGPPLFAHYRSPLSAIIERSSGRQTLSHNGVDRIKFWWQALKVFVHHPLDGAGYHTLASAGAFYTPSGWPRSPLAHNGYLQPLTDGGLLLAIPVVVATVVVAWWALRGSTRALLSRDSQGSAPVTAAVSLALLAALAHSGVDFDWSHPALMVEAGLLAACVAPPIGVAVGHRFTAMPAARRVASFGVFGVLLAVLAVMVPALHQWQRGQPNLRLSTSELLGRSDATFGDYRPAKALLSSYVDGERQLTTDQVQRALDLTADDARVDLHLALLRDAVGARTGLLPGASVDAYRLVGLVHGSTAPYVPDLALVLSESGDESSARALLARDIAAQVARGSPSPDLESELSQWARTLGTGAGYACQLRSAMPLLADTQRSDLPTPTASCRRSIKVAARHTEDR
jgi:hypothetical protein